MPNPRYEGEIPPEELTWELNPDKDPALKKGAGCLVLPVALGTAALAGLGGAISTHEMAAPTSVVTYEKAPSGADELYEDNTITIQL